jgi:pimeloyl-ACP methyl ester carboxylesterase
MPSFIHNTHRLHYREQGDGPLLLILPGNTASSACHSGELAYFGQHYRTVALDFLGTGQSDREAVWSDDWWEQAAYDAASLVDHLGQESCLAMGTSGGAIVALLLAILIPERVQAITVDSCVERFPAERLETLVAERAQQTPEQVAGYIHFAIGIIINTLSCIRRRRGMRQYRYRDNCM